MAQTRLAPQPPRWGIRISPQDITVAGVLGAVAILLGLTGFGFIAFPTPAANATIMHIPAIIAGILQGPVVGALVGGIFGLFSFTRATTPIFANPIIAFLPRILIGVVAYFVFRMVAGRFARAFAALMIGAGIFTILGPGAQRFESAYAAGKISSSWLIDVYHSVAALTAPSIWIGLVAGVIAGAAAFALLRGDNAAPAAAAVAGTLTNTIGVLTLIVLFGFLPAGAAFVIGATHGLPEVILATIVAVPVYRAVRTMRGSAG